MLKSNVSIPEAIVAINKAHDLLGNAWIEVYTISEDVMEGELHDLRMKINNLQCKCTVISELLKLEFKK